MKFSSLPFVDIHIFHTYIYIKMVALKNMLTPADFFTTFCLSLCTKIHFFVYFFSFHWFHLFNVILLHRYLAPECAVYFSENIRVFFLLFSYFSWLLFLVQPFNIFFLALPWCLHKHTSNNEREKENERERWRERRRRKKYMYDFFRLFSRLIHLERLLISKTQNFIDDMTENLLWNWIARTLHNVQAVPFGIISLISAFSNKNSLQNYSHDLN